MKRTREMKDDSNQRETKTNGHLPVVEVISVVIVVEDVTPAGGNEKLVGFGISC